MDVLFARVCPLPLQAEAAWSAWKVAGTNLHSQWQGFLSPLLWSKQEIVFKIELFSSFQLLEMAKRVKPTWLGTKRLIVQKLLVISYVKQGGKKES